MHMPEAASITKHHLADGYLIGVVRYDDTVPETDQVAPWSENETEIRF